MPLSRWVHLPWRRAAGERGGAVGALRGGAGRGTGAGGGRREGGGRGKGGARRDDVDVGADEVEAGAAGPEAPERPQGRRLRARRAGGETAEL